METPRLSPAQTRPAAGPEAGDEDRREAIRRLALAALSAVARRRAEAVSAPPPPPVRATADPHAAVRFAAE